VGKFGGGKVWRIEHLKVLARKSLANIIESLDGTCYLTSLAHVVSLVFPRWHARFMLRNMSASASFAINAMICGYHVDKEVWPNPVDEEELTCEPEVGNLHDHWPLQLRN